MNQLTLFNLQEFESGITPVNDPHWDEIENWDNFKEKLSIEGHQPTMIVSVPEQSDSVLEQSSCAPLDQHDGRWCGSAVTNKLEVYSDFVPEQSDSVLEQQLTPVPEQTHWIETYSPSNRKEHKYYRYCWKPGGGRKIHHVHIPGGNTSSATTVQRKLLIVEAITEGSSPQEINQLIRDWSMERKPPSRRMAT